jgi:hypothetical protein
MKTRDRVMNVTILCIAGRTQKGNLSVTKQWEDMIDTVVCGHAREVMSCMPDSCVQTAITSPPYW